MHAESAPSSRPACRFTRLIGAAAICLVAGLALLGVGVVLVDALGGSTEPLLMSPFRWEPVVQRS